MSAKPYLKEKFDYLQDKYKVKLLYNPEYTTKNTLATLWHARDLFYGKNTYLLDEILKNTPRIICLNKADMAEEKRTMEWIEYFQN